MRYVTNQFLELKQEELLIVEGGKLESVSDWLLAGGAVCACFVVPQIGVPLAVMVAIFS